MVGMIKEKKKIDVLLTPEMKLIIERWGNPDKSPDNYIFLFLVGYNTPMEQKSGFKRIKNAAFLTNFGD
jgi:hypothetical protein